MAGTKIDNWKSFEKNMFQYISNQGDNAENKVHVLAGKIDSVKSAYTAEPSTVKHVLKSIFTLGIYNLVTYFKEKNQANTLEAVKSGIDSVHSAMSFIAAKRSEVIVSDAFIKSAQVNFLREGEKIPKGLQLLVGKNDDIVFPKKQFIRASMGGCNVDFSFDMGPLCTIRIDNGKGKPEIVTVDNLEEALFNLEKNIAKESNVFGSKIVEKMIRRYDERLEETCLPNSARMYTGGAGVELRKALKEHQLGICRELLENRYALSQDQLKYLVSRFNDFL